MMLMHSTIHPIMGFCNEYFILLRMLQEYQIIKRLYLRRSMKIPNPHFLMKWHRLSKELNLRKRIILSNMVPCGPDEGLTMSDEQGRGERLQIMLSPEELTVLDDFRFKLRMPSRAAAVRELLKRGLAAEGYTRAAPGGKSADYGVIATAGDGNARDGRKAAGK